MSSAITTGDVVFDIGANVGFYTLLAAQRVGVQGAVVAFEPVARNLAYLDRHLRLNKVRNVKVYAAAVSAASGTARFDLSVNSHSGRLSDMGTVRVPLVNLDELWREGRVPPPNVMKIDVEGAEAEVLAGAQRLLHVVRPVIFLATHGRAVHDRCMRMLGAAGYQVRPLFGGAITDTTDEIVASPAVTEMHTQPFGPVG